MSLNYPADSGLSPVLRQVGSTVITNSQCVAGSGVGQFSGDKVVCADGSQGRRFCYVKFLFFSFLFLIMRSFTGIRYTTTKRNYIQQGDDGGPMADFREDVEEWFAVGVAWIGDSTVECQGSNKPNIYARVSHYVDWIYNRTGIPPVTRPTTTSSTSTTTSTTTTTTTTTTTRTTTTEDPNVFSCRYIPI